MGMDNRHTIADICASQGKNPDSVRKQWTRTGMPGAFNRHYVPTHEELVKLNLSGEKAVKAATPKKESPTAPAAPKQPAKEAAQKVSKIKRRDLLFAPFILATMASCANMYLICLHLCDGDWRSASMLTAVFSGSALAFIAAKAVHNWAMAVIYLLIGFEWFCNGVGVYHGLLGRTGTPTRFLGMVTDIFSSGTHGTAITLGAAMAAIICAVQIISIKTIIKDL